MVCIARVCAARALVSYACRSACMSVATYNHRKPWQHLFSSDTKGFVCLGIFMRTCMGIPSFDLGGTHRYVPLPPYWRNQE